MKILNTVILILMPITFTVSIINWTFFGTSIESAGISIFLSIFTFFMALSNRKLIKKAEEMK